mgnify:CR=1 FL=1
MARQVETTYGDALLELALEEGSLNMLYEEAQALVTVLQENEELLRILFYQTGKTSKKYRSCKCDKCGCTYRCTEGINREASA